MPTTGGILRLEDGTGGGNFVGLKAPDTAVSPNIVWTLPSTEGAANQFLKTNGSGLLSWSSVALADVTGTLSVAKGGTSTISFTGNRLVVSNGAGSALVAHTAVGTTQVMYADSNGLPAGDSGLTWNGTSLSVTNNHSSAAVIVKNSTGPVLSLVASDNESIKVAVPTGMSPGGWAITLPENSGNAGQILATDGSGVLSWETASASSNPLGSYLNAPIVSDGNGGVSWNQFASFSTPTQTFTPAIYSCTAAQLGFSFNNVSFLPVLSQNFYNFLGESVSSVYQDGPLVFVATTSPSQTVKFSKDSGQSFASITCGTNNVPSGSYPQVGVARGRFFVSNTGGLSYSDNLTTWTDAGVVVSNTLSAGPADDAIGNLAIVDIDTTVLYSSDKGVSWSTLPTLGITNPKHIFGTNGKFYLGSDSGLHVSDNLGISWAQLYSANSVHFVIVVGDRIYIYRDSQYLTLSLDAGATWGSEMDVGSGALAEAAIHGRRIYIAGSDGLQYSDDDGVTFNVLDVTPAFSLLVQGAATPRFSFSGTSRNWQLRQQRLKGVAAICSSGSTKNVTASPLYLGPGRWLLEGYAGITVTGNTHAVVAFSKTSDTLPGSSTTAVDNDGELTVNRETITDEDTVYLKSEIVLLENTAYYLVVKSVSATSLIYGKIVATQVTG